jgi:hypothetical protein
MTEPEVISAVREDGLLYAVATYRYDDGDQPATFKYCALVRAAGFDQKKHDAIRAADPDVVIADDLGEFRRLADAAFAAVSK